MNLTFKQFLNEAKYAHHNREGIMSQLEEIVYSSFYEKNYIGDHESVKDAARDAIRELQYQLEKIIPSAHVRNFTGAAAGAFQELDPEDFADKESYIDALVNEIIKDLRWYLKRVEL